MRFAGTFLTSLLRLRPIIIFRPVLAWRELQCLSGAVANESPPCFFQSCTFAMAQFALPYLVEHAVVGDVVRHAQRRFGISGRAANVPRSAKASASARRTSP